MKVLGSSLFIVVFALLAVSAFPRKDHVHKTLEHAKTALRKQVGDIVNWLENSLDNSREQNGCTDDYQRKVDGIFNDATVDIDRCLVEGEINLNEIESHMRENNERVLNRQARLQQSLNNCANLNGTDFFECYVQSFDANLLELDQISTISQQTLIEYQRNQSNSELILEGCVNLAVINAKTQTTLAYNDFQKCIQNEGIPSTTSPSPPVWNYTVTPYYPSPGWNETTLNSTSPPWNYTVTPYYPSPGWNETTLNSTSPPWNYTVTPYYPSPGWNETTLNSTSPPWNYTVTTTPSWNFTTLNSTSPAWNETTLGWNFTTLNSTSPAWNETTLGWNVTTLNNTSPAWNETTLSWNVTTLNSTSPAWNETTLNFTTPAWNVTTLNITTPAWNVTTLNFNSTTPLFNATASVNVTTEAPEESTTQNNIEEAGDAIQKWLNHIWGTLQNN